MTDDLHLSIVPSDPDGALLHSALQKALIPPVLPDGFRAHVLANVLNDRLQEVELRRKALEREHAQALQALIAACAFAAGACANLAVPWLRDALGLDSAVTMPAIALMIGLIAGASVWVERFGKPGALFGVGQN
jgi:hypothetical protein